MSVTSLPRASGVAKAAPGAVPLVDRALQGAMLVSFLAALYMAFIYAPADAVQGDVQRIFYFHLSMALLMYVAFFVVFLGSILFLWKHDTRWDVYARCSAEIGVVFTTLVLITGSLWGRPIWGTWWSWDARLTTTLILWAVYVVYLMLRSSSGDPQRGARYAAILGIIGFADVPIVQMSVVWWRTLHPGPVIQLEGGGGLPPQMWLAFLVSLIAFTLLYVYLLRQRVQIEQLRNEIELLQESEG